MDKIKALYSAQKTVYTIDDLRLIWGYRNPDALKSGIKYFVDKGKLLRLKKGLYALFENYDPLEAAQKLIVPSYISLETALQKHGILFQATEEITCFARYSKHFSIDGQNYIYHAMPDNLLLNPLGIIREKHYHIASPERAVADFVNLRGAGYFDNLRPIRRNELEKITKIYSKKTTQKHLKNLIRNL